MVLTGERTTAATVKIRWMDIDFKANTIYFPKTKNGEERIVQMPPVLARALHELSKFGSKAEDPVFGWKTRFGMAQMIAHARKTAEIGTFRPHDIGRHSFGKRMTQKAGLRRPQLKAAGNWKSDNAVERYEHYELDEVSAAVRDVDTSEIWSFDTDKETGEDKKP